MKPIAVRHHALGILVAVVAAVAACSSNSFTATRTDGGSPETGGSASVGGGGTSNVAGSGSGGLGAGAGGRGVGGRGAGGRAPGSDDAGSTVVETDASIDASAGGAPASDAGNDGGDATPAISMDGLVLWLRADVGVTEQNGSVTVWHDQSDSGVDVTQSVVASQPTVSRVNGRILSVVFDGVDDFMDLPTVDADFSHGISMFAVATERTSGSSCYAMVEASNGSELDDIFFGNYFGVLGFEVLNDSVSGGEVTKGLPELVGVIHSPPGVVEFLQNGQFSAPGVAAMAANVVRTKAYLGKTLYADCSPFHGALSEVLVYDRAVSKAEAKAIEEVTTARWGL